MTKQSAALVLMLLIGCGRSTDGNDEEAGGRQISIGATPSDQRQSAFLVEPDRYLNLRDLAGALRRAGHACETVRTYDQLEQNGERMNVYKVDCLEYSYQLTFIDGRHQVRRWSGNIVSE